jgi:hypothetical protein
MFMQFLNYTLNFILYAAVTSLVAIRQYIELNFSI